jgi:hypothetical protein
VPVCPSCNFGLPWTYTTCPDCGGDVRKFEERDEDLGVVASPDIDGEDDDEDAVDVTVGLARVAEVTPDVADEPPIEDVSVVVEATNPARKAKKTSRTKRNRPAASRSRPARRGRAQQVRPPKLEVVRDAAVLEPEREPEAIVPSLEPAEIDVAAFGEQLGAVEEVAGFIARAVDVGVFEKGFVPEEGEPIAFDEIAAAGLRKTRLDLYRELTLTLVDGTMRTLRWLPEYNDDPGTIAILRKVLGERLRSFTP